MLSGGRSKMARSIANLMLDRDQGTAFAAFTVEGDGRALASFIRLYCSRTSAQVLHLFRLLYHTHISTHTCVLLSCTFVCIRSQHVVANVCGLNASKYAPDRSCTRVLPLRYIDWDLARCAIGLPVSTYHYALAWLTAFVPPTVNVGFPAASPALLILFYCDSTGLYLVDRVC